MRISLFGCIAAACVCLSVLSVNAVDCTSPNGQNVISFKLAEGVPQYDVTFAGKAVIRDSALGLNIEKKPFGEFIVKELKKDSHDSTWKPVIGERESVRDHYNGLIVTLRETAAPNRELDIEFRAYDEGTVFRYVLSKQPQLDGAVVSSEATQFRFAENFGAYPIKSTEAHYQEEPTPVNDCKRAYIPLTVELGNGAMASLFEAYVAEQPPCTLEKKGENTLSPKFRKGKLTLMTPVSLTWRGLLLSKDVAGLIYNRYLVETLNPPCAIEDTSWIKPGIFIDRSGGITTDNIKKNMDFAAEHNIGYVHIDWSWYGTERKWSEKAIKHFQEKMPEKSRKKLEGQDWIKNTTGDPTTVAHGYVPYLQFNERFYHVLNFIDIDIPEVIRYGNTKNVGLSLYVNGGTLIPYGDHEVEDVWKTISSWGVQALKPGFVGCSSQDDIKWLRNLVALAAKYKLVLNIHDGYIADGMRRTYPNLLTQEGGGGRETNPTITHELMLPFTRHLVGAHDHTPTLYSGSDGRTKLFELAQLVVYHGARQSARNVYGSRNSFGPEMEFLEKVPTVWQDVRMLKAEPGDCIVTARRNGNRWFIGGMNDEDPRDVKLSLNFLENGKKYQATIFSDVKDSRDAEKKVMPVTSATVLDVSMNAKGGLCAIIELAK
ncbi:MAG: glycoside hydrolase family 97 N-terminal domain-containing protein [Kiritimatiellae bacterium]|jgi:alpha-glucosidase|nr:glycoside hydrolase family 97 N-terminal domain-containing protein [Kiritimatiellia bacterium]